MFCYISVGRRCQSRHCWARTSIASAGGREGAPGTAVPAGRGTSPSPRSRCKWKKRRRWTVCRRGVAPPHCAAKHAANASSTSCPLLQWTSGTSGQTQPRRHNRSRYQLTSSQPDWRMPLWRTMQVPALTNTDHYYLLWGRRWGSAPPPVYT